MQIGNNGYGWAEYIYQNNLLSTMTPTMDELWAVLRDIAKSHPYGESLLTSDDFLEDLYYGMEQDFGYTMPY